MPAFELCAEDWHPTQGNCPWNQAAVAGGAAAFGRWPVRLAEAGAYRVEVRRWPRKADAPLAGVPTGQKIMDACLRDQPATGLLYGGTPKALPVARVRLQVGANVQEIAVDRQDKAAIFTVKGEAGPTDIEATLLDQAGHALCSAYYVSIRKLDPAK